MEFHGDCSSNIEMWEWQGDEYTLQGNTGFENTPLWDGEPNDSSFWGMLEVQTPIRDCTDFSYGFLDLGENTKNESEKCRDSSHQVKRRRMLQFPSDLNDDSVNSKVGGGSHMGDGIGNLQWPSEWNPGFQDDRCDSRNEGLDQASEGWTDNCFNDSNMLCNEMIDYATLDDRIDISELCNIPPEIETNVVKETPIPTPCKKFKGRKSYITTPMSLTASVASPFSLIKPCEVQGDLTLEDINQRIHAPAQSRSKHKKDEEHSINYPTSSFTGKPVVVKTKIPFKGGGSITIMRTKG